VKCSDFLKELTDYRDHQIVELPDDLRTRLRTAIVSKCEKHKHDAQHPHLAEEKEPGK